MNEFLKHPGTVECILSMKMDTVLSITVNGKNYHVFPFFHNGLKLFAIHNINYTTNISSRTDYLETDLKNLLFKNKLEKLLND